MTAHPVTCLVDYEDGYRLVFTVEDDELHAAHVRITGESNGNPVDLRINLDGPALTHLGKALDEMRVANGDDPTDGLRNELWATKRALQDATERQEEIAILVQSLKRGDPPERAVELLGEIAHVMSKDYDGPQGMPWHQVGDGAFASPFGTIRKCIDCDCLVAGGPTRCRRCVDALSEKETPTP